MTGSSQAAYALSYANNEKLRFQKTTEIILNTEHLYFTLLKMTQLGKAGSALGRPMRKDSDSSLRPACARVKLQKLWSRRAGSLLLSLV